MPAMDRPLAWDSPLMGCGGTHLWPPTSRLPLGVLGNLVSPLWVPELDDLVLRLRRDVSVNNNLVLAVGTGHQSLLGLSHVQLLTFHTPWRESGVESKNEALCAQGGTCQDTCSVTYTFSGVDFMGPVLGSPHI